jgi:hypothetical protein
MKRMSPSSEDAAVRREVEAERPSEVSADVLRFICEWIGSLDHLSVLSLLASLPARSWSAQAVAEQLKLTESLAEELLEHLSSQRLLVRSAEASGVEFSYGPEGEALEELVKRSLVAYRDQRLDVVKVLTSSSFTRMRLKVSWLIRKLSRASAETPAPDSQRSVLKSLH